MTSRADVHDNVSLFKASLVKEQRRFARAFTVHLLRSALARELGPSDALAVDAVVNRSECDAFAIKLLQLPSCPTAGVDPICRYSTPESESSRMNGRRSDNLGEGAGF